MSAHPRGLASLTFWQRWPTVAELSRGRDNNFNLVRFIAASAVLFTHAFALSAGSAAAEPLRDLLRMTLGQIAVDVFFVTSGFLVTRSLDVGQELRAFFRARCLRIYPALVVAVTLTVVVVGLFFTSLDLRSFLMDRGTWTYLLRNATLVTGIQHLLPGAFEHTPWRGLVNASLWTLPYEIFMYALVAVLWLVSSARVSRRRWFAGGVIVVAGIALLANAVVLNYVPSNLVRLTAMFFSGGALYLLRDRVRLHAAAAVALLAALAAIGPDSRLYAPGYTFMVPYVVLYLALSPGGWIRSFNRLGDYSYGIYIYAWPVQQALAASWPGIDAVQMVVASGAVTLALSVVSWHLIEKRALALKRRRSAVVAPTVAQSS